MSLHDYRLPPPQGAKPKRVVIFLHGLGDRGDGGLLSIGQIWQRAMPDCEFLCPDAPFPLDDAPLGFQGRQWFSLRTFTPQSIAEGVTNAAPILNSYIDQVLTTRQLTPKNIALVGFSQGTMMALHVAPRRGKTVGSVIGYSGMLAVPDKLAAEKKTAPPTLLVHGTADEVVPYACMAEAEGALRTTGIPTRTLTCPLTGHTIDDLGLRIGQGFLLENLRSHPT
jgi:phospholipase/carboxylesterase